eukprot:CAMPEP_0184310618 /NCGR_PEP_ID=MMETSP1049-20130417/32098_1 /TAXON_ID=77928 /ORGANISM="Proteomonas sulcata, Strain CCMP704" /LENGTH=44 /DNA_ID= /DNA_START= /DNA_END= /DNA_ORIENTATION=
MIPAHLSSAAAHAACHPPPARHLSFCKLPEIEFKLGAPAPLPPH